MAVTETAKTVRGITGVEAGDFTGRVKDGKIIEYRARREDRFWSRGSRRLADFPHTTPIDILLEK